MGRGQRAIHRQPDHIIRVCGIRRGLRRNQLDRIGRQRRDAFDDDAVRPVTQRDAVGASPRAIDQIAGETAGRDGIGAGTPAQFDHLDPRGGHRHPAQRDGMDTRCRGDRVAARLPRAAVDHMVAPGPARDRIRAATGDDQVIPRRSDQRVGPGCAVDQDGPTATKRRNDGGTRRGRIIQTKRPKHRIIQPQCPAARAVALHFRRRHLDPFKAQGAASGA